METWRCLLVDNTLYSWLIGLGVVSLGAGFVVTWATLKFLRRILQLDKVEDPRSFGIPSWLTGLTERLVFTILVGVGVDVAIPVMIYILVKIVFFWQVKYRNLPNVGERVGTSLVGTTLSLLFAMIGGIIAKGRICI
jgi:hypothetical protein